MIVMILVVFLLFLLGIPISFSLGIASLIGLLWKGMPLVVLVQRMFTALDSFALVAVPLFILAGELMSEGGISKRLVHFAQMLVGHLKGGLAMVSVVAAMFFSSVSGSAIADTAAIGGIMIPSMSSAGYDRRFAAPLVAAAGAIGPIIPPSIPLVLYGVMANTSIGELFLGGVVPGILMGIGLMLVTYWISVKRHYVGRESRASLREIVLGLRDAVLAMIMPLIIIGGILTGQFTATESGVVAVVYALIVGMLVYRELHLKDIPQIFYNTTLTTGTTLIVIANASIFTWLLTIEQVPQQLTQALIAWSLPPWVVLLALNAILLVAGTFIDTISALTIFTPLFLPVVLNLGIDPVHFGVIMAVNLTIGMITPPVGVNLFVASGIARISLGDMMRDLMPLFAVLLVVLLIATYVPGVVMALPAMVR